MRQTQIFAGSSHPEIVDKICARLGSSRAEAVLGKFSNGETSVQLNTSIRDQDVFIVQSGSNNINDNVMELLIMVSACKSGSARSVTAVMPYFPYSRQSKKKSHRGAITARLIANILHEAGVNHVITLDLHASQMQGFFHCPVDNLIAEPTLARWIKENVRDWRRAVVVSKNPGGTKRVTSLADALKLNFGIVMTDRRRPGSGRGSVNASVIFEPEDEAERKPDDYEEMEATFSCGTNGASSPDRDVRRPPLSRRRTGQTGEPMMSPLRQTHQVDDAPSSAREAGESQTLQPHTSSQSQGTDGTTDDEADDENEEGHDNRGEVVTGRLIHGHIVDDDDDGGVSSPMLDGYRTPYGGRGEDDDSIPDHMLASMYSVASSARHARGGGGGGGATNSLLNGLGGSGDAVASSDDEEDNLRNPDLESTVTLVGNVRDRPVFIVDDMIDKSASWIAAAETVVKRGGATAVYCFATHGIFGGDALAEMEACDCIDRVVVTNSIPIPQRKFSVAGADTSNLGETKLRVLDVSGLLAEAIRRNHHGETIEQLYLHYD